MKIAGVIEMVAGVALLAGVTRLGGYVVAAWLTAIALSLVFSGKFLDVAVRDLVMACGAFTLAKLSEARGGVRVTSTSSSSPRKAAPVSA